MQTSNGQCLLVDKFSGDFRANLTPVQIATCDDDDGQKWDIITSGEHNDQAGTILVVSTLVSKSITKMQSVSNLFLSRLKLVSILILAGLLGTKSISFHVADVRMVVRQFLPNLDYHIQLNSAGGLVTDSQLFSFAGGSGPLALTPKNAASTCLTAKGKLLDEADCNKGDTNQSFSFGDSSGAATPASTPAGNSTPSVLTPVPIATSISTQTATQTSQAPVQNAPVQSSFPGVSATATSKNPTSAVPVLRAGGVLNPQAAAEANVRDDTATRAFSSASLKAANGQCLFIDPTAGDFRQNLIPVQLKTCDGSPGEKFDVVTQGKHNNVPNSILVVSSLVRFPAR